MLYTLYRIDPNWTEKALLGRMDLDKAAEFDPYLWEGFLWSPQFSDDLLAAFKDIYFKILNNLGQIPERSRDHAAQLFIHMAIPPNRGITTEEARGVLYSFDSSALSNAAWALRDLLMGAEDKSLVLWRETIGPWFAEAWPKRPMDKSQTL